MDEKLKSGGNVPLSKEGLKPKDELEGDGEVNECRCRIVDDVDAESEERSLEKREACELRNAPIPIRSAVSYLIKSQQLYKVPAKGSPSPIVIDDLDISVAPGKTVRADYILKFQTSNALWGCSLGFLGVDSSKDNLMGTAHWAMSTNGSSSTTYSFMTEDPRFYSNNKAGVADSNVPFAGLDDPAIFNSIKINIEYYNGGNKKSVLSLEFHRDLYLYHNQTVQVIPGSSIEYRIF